MWILLLIHRNRKQNRVFNFFGMLPHICFVTGKTTNKGIEMDQRFDAVSNLALVKPDKAKAVENYLIQMARFGQLPGKVSEQGLIEILEKVSQQTEKKTTVKAGAALTGSAQSAAVQLRSLRRCRRAPFCSSRATSASFPLATASCRAVLPLALQRFTEAPRGEEELNRETLETPGYCSITKPLSYPQTLGHM
ncbi:hypothetical protein IHE44_0002239 [Lamprotornis superbus]|uniref:Programmed cell death protein 5 n=1 Tax=Lamprotornis superbus TaxID=245042 RepID=A0A835NUK8_9PASS|nr:hypothetical protein IHE44_0002239 [Lamprotornis superbus]